MLLVLLSAAAPAPSLPVSASADTLLARPLFSVTRRPPNLDAAASTAAAAEPTPHLAGTVIAGAGAPDRGSSDRIAFLSLPSSPKLLIVHEGDTVGRYTIVSIRAGELLADSPAGAVTFRIGPRENGKPIALPVLVPRQAIGAPDQDE